MLLILGAGAVSAVIFIAVNQVWKYVDTAREYARKLMLAEADLDILKKRVQELEKKVARTALFSGRS